MKNTIKEIIKGLSIKEATTLLKQVIKEIDIKEVKKEKTVKFDDIKAAKLVIGKGNKIRPCLNTIKVEKNIATVSNLYQTIFFNTSLANGLYTPEQFVENKLVEMGVNITDYPEIKKPYNEKTIKINSKDFINGLKTTLKFVDSGENTALAGIHINKNVLVASDTFRMLKYTLKQEIDINTTIPSEAVKILIAELDKKDIEISILIDKNNICFEYSDRILISKIIELSFPDYKSIYNGMNKSGEIETRKEYLQPILEKCLQYGKDDLDAKNAFMLKNNGGVKAKSSQLGTYCGEIVKLGDMGIDWIGLNSKFFIDAIDNIDGIVNIYFGDSNKKPILISNTINIDAILMPLYVEDWSV